MLCCVCKRSGRLDATVPTDSAQREQHARRICAVGSVRDSKSHINVVAACARFGAEQERPTFRTCRTFLTFRTIHAATRQAPLVAAANPVACPANCGRGHVITSTHAVAIRCESVGGSPRVDLHGDFISYLRAARVSASHAPSRWLVALFTLLFPANKRTNGKRSGMKIDNGLGVHHIHSCSFVCCQHHNH